MTSKLSRFSDQEIKNQDSYFLLSLNAEFNCVRVSGSSVRYEGVIKNRVRRFASACRRNQRNYFYSTLFAHSKITCLRSSRLEGSFCTLVSWFAGILTHYTGNLADLIDYCMKYPIGDQEWDLWIELQASNKKSETLSDVKLSDGFSKLFCKRIFPW